MKVLVAIDSFKGSISSIEGSKGISEGIREVDQEAEIVTLPLADGGEGTVEALVYATNGDYRTKTVVGPLGGKIDAVYGILRGGKTAVIEIATACGLPLVPTHKRNPMIATTYGVGELILDAIESGCRDFVIGLGGSATNDGGVGMLQALGYSFLNQQGEEVGFGGRHLFDIHQIDSSGVHPKLNECTFRVACDVDNPLYGPDGASHIFGPQKGATPEMVEMLDQGLKRFAQVVQTQLNVEINHIKGGGAAGGLGAAFAGFLKGQLQSGIEIVMDFIELEKKIQGANLVITGEGKLDGQTARGKVPYGIGQVARKYSVPVIALAGATEKEAVKLNEGGITAYFSIVNAPMRLEEAMDSLVTYQNLKITAGQVYRLVQAVRLVQV
ncbi:glycerate kinase [Mesobacillus maritimus]|uniref:glycerate kinase family protein n=1 Tax=Mesobacillus maritimus TaxID=1643336 RepID=UPI00203B780F|nr:glycerate kinase [Mesobacillus maritimus]MCM3670865.1 glycerate kinase [Mesobacillus maritimus]